MGGNRTKWCGFNNYHATELYGWGGGAAVPARDTEYTLAAALMAFYMTPQRPGSRGSAPEGAMGRGTLSASEITGAP